MSMSIKIKLMKKGVTVTDLAEKIGYSRVHVSNVIHGRWKSEKCRRAIAKELNTNFRKLWKV